MRILAVSDSHIPERADWLPEQVEQYILSQKFDAVIHAGDVIDSRLVEFIRSSLGTEVLVVRGNMDYLRFPKYVKIPVESLVLGVVHGDRVYPRGNIAALTRLAHTLGAQVLVSGHTHMPFVVYDKSGVLNVNPGSVTGVWGGSGGSGTPSFAEISVSSRNVSVVVYELVGSALVKKHVYSYTL